LTLTDLVSRAEYTKGLQASSSSGVNYNVGPGFETQIPPKITLGLAYANHFLFKTRNITAFDFEQISDSRFADSENKVIRFGTEFWFFKDVFGVRTGYSTPLSRPGTIHLGLSFRTLNGDFQTDLAYLQPVQDSADVSSGSAVGNFNTDGINYEKFHIGVSYRFGAGEELPPPKVAAYVKPPAFTPSAGEKAAFYLDTSEDVSINRWSVLIYDENNHLVRGLRGKGSPPVKLLWAGEDDAYQPLPAGIYTWAFQVQDNLDHVGSTHIQTVEILGAPVAGDPKNTEKLDSILAAQKQTLTQERMRLTQLAQESLKKLRGAPEPLPNTPAAKAAAAPAEAAGNTLSADAGNVLPINFNNISPEAELSAHFEKNEKGDPIVAISYRSKLTVVPYLCQEAAEVIKTTANSVGPGLKGVSTRVYYGKNELLFQTPIRVAADYAQGRITRDQLLQSSDVHLNGQKVVPNAL
jgi:hypothetical protein